MGRLCLLTASGLKMNKSTDCIIRPDKKQRVIVLPKLSPVRQFSPNDRGDVTHLYFMHKLKHQLIAGVPPTENVMEGSLLYPVN